MLKRKFRLNLSQKQTLARSFHAAFFLLRFDKNSLAYNRYGFIVSKNVDKSAVGRNRLKRTVREVIEKYSHHMQQGNDMIFILKKGIGSIQKEKIQEYLYSFLASKGLLA